MFPESFKLPITHTLKIVSFCLEHRLFLFSMCQFSLALFLLTLYLCPHPVSHYNIGGALTAGSKDSKFTSGMYLPNGSIVSLPINSLVA